ncbi:alpha-amylase family glycosyl hydrolase [Halonatronum saccharophilum]|uniref:alpha-amylase family glycosyl hydrolase n=1 Tax=Halonatronum saccharophilum TaxID=150060 RepID=UPI000488D29C|nr:alpha-amylase family glycosyl hydrolase [Halonatronum saccharophilum]
MASDTKVELRNQIIYSVYVRNHSEEGTFKGVEKDLDRIKDLGTDILWLLPIHPIGKKNKKGDLGCPYSIKDYKGINPEYGDLDDFRSLVEAVHQKGMKVIIDVVYNHTSHDSKLLEEHPEWFYRTKDGETGNKVGDWYDIIDLDYDNKELWDYQIDALKYWVKEGVDGFRCDVASLLPLDFWQRARKEVAQVKEDVIWLAESVEPDFIRALRREGFIALSDSQTYDAFDATYDYDVFQYFKKYKEGKISLGQYLEKVRSQEYIYPDNYVKMRYIENHDQPRATTWFPSEEELINWTAFYYFQQGLTLIYAGQEAQDDNTPSLFDRDLVDWSGESEEYLQLLKKLGEIKRDEIVAKGYYELLDLEVEGVAVASYRLKNERRYGIFNLESKVGQLALPIVDGSYTNLINGEEIEVVGGKLSLNNSPIIISVKVEDGKEEIFLEEM